MTFFAAIFTVHRTYAQDDPMGSDIEQRISELRALVSSGRFEIVVDKIYPESGHEIEANPEYGFSLQCRGVDTLVSNLPYFGMVYPNPFGGNDLRFKVYNEHDMQYYYDSGRVIHIPKVSFELFFYYHNKNETDCKIKITAEAYEVITYIYEIDVSIDGKATMSVTSQFLQPIRYEGRIRPLPDGTNKK